MGTVTPHKAFSWDSCQHSTHSYQTRVPVDLACSIGPPRGSRYCLICASRACVRLQNSLIGTAVHLQVHVGVEDSADSVPPGGAMFEGACLPAVTRPGTDVSMSLEADVSCSRDTWRYVWPRPLYIGPCFSELNQRTSYLCDSIAEQSVCVLFLCSLCLCVSVCVCVRVRILLCYFRT